MFKMLAHKIVGTKNERELKRLQPQVVAINALEAQLSALTDEELWGKTSPLKQRVAAAADRRLGRRLEEALPKRSRSVAKAGRRILSMRHFDVQLIGGMVLHEGKIAEMATGEGKDPGGHVAGISECLSGRGVPRHHGQHDYLAKRDTQWMGRSITRWGSVWSTPARGVPSCSTDRPDDRPADGQPSSLHPAGAYGADITYGTNSEFGFTTSRQHEICPPRILSQRKLNYAL